MLCWSWTVPCPATGDITSLLWWETSLNLTSFIWVDNKFGSIWLAKFIFSFLCLAGVLFLEVGSLYYNCLLCYLFVFFASSNAAITLLKYIFKFRLLIFSPPLMPRYYYDVLFLVFPSSLDRTGFAAPQLLLCCLLGCTQLLQSPSIQL